MREKVVGIYEVGYHKIKIVVNDRGDGGYGNWLTNGSDVPEIGVSCKPDSPRWIILRTLLHEVEEMEADRLMCRYFPHHHLADDVTCATFFMTHAQFSEMQGRTADLVARCYEDICKVFVQWRKEDTIAKRTAGQEKNAATAANQ